MKVHSGNPAYIYRTLTILLLVGVWLAFAPTAIGGRANYVTVNGNSMEPGMARGDLVIVRQAASYRVGDVVTYRHPAIGAVIHRIVDSDGERFTLQGDNNTWLDSYYPTSDDIIGKQWLHIPSLGTYILQIRQPRTLLLAGALVGVALMSTSTRSQSRPSGMPATSRKREKRATTRLTQPISPTLYDARGREMAGSLAIIGLACIVALTFAFTRPTERIVMRELPYQHSGTFAYSATAPAGIYDDAEARTGDPIFRQVTDTVAVSFDYRFDSDLPTVMQGKAALTATISDSSGWTRTISVVPPQPVDANRVMLSGELDLREITRITDFVSTQTGMRHDTVTITLQPQITIEGTLGGNAVHDTFSPDLPLYMDALQLQLADSVRVDPSSLQPAISGAVSLRGSTPNSLSLLGRDIPVTTVRLATVVGLLVVLAVAGWLVWSTLRVNVSSEVDRIEAEYGGILVNVTDLGTSPFDRTIGVATFADLVRLAQRDNTPVLHQQFGMQHTYCVHVGSVRYLYTPEEIIPENEMRNASI